MNNVRIGEKEDQREEPPSWQSYLERLNPSYARVWVHKGYVLLQLKRYREALAAYEEALRLDPGHRGAASNKAGVLARLLRYREALAACEYACQLQPENARIVLQKSCVLVDLGRYREALGTLLQALRLHWRTASSPSSLLPRQTEQQPILRQRAEKELAACEQRLRRRPDDRQARYQQALLLSGLGRGEEALAVYERLALARPGDPVPRCCQVLLLALLGRLDEASERYEELQTLQQQPAASDKHLRALFGPMFSRLLALIR
uniref:Uncharacterized protein n=1 Tax=Thermogemmatispora argillosa TaxID=2045280 RepID=A0A455T617_9CHLR|nr:hypothetical protein KTA_12130 [Thermogemmatispora argillosa]